MDKPLWQPSPERVEDANLTAFMEKAKRDWGVQLSSYGEAHDCQRTAAAMIEDLGRLGMGEIFRIGLHEFVLEAIGRTNRLGAEISSAYFH